MTMRLWHQSFTELDRLPGYKAALGEHFRRVALPDTEVELHGMAPGTYPTEYPGTDIGFAAIQHLHTRQILERAIDAERQGFDAYLISTLPDPGLQEAKSLVDIPVIGYGVTAMHTACFLGSRFGVVSFIDELAPLYAANAMRYGLMARAGPVRPLGLGFSDVVRGYERPEPVLAAFREAVRALATEGVDVVIPGEAPLALLLQRAGLYRVDEIPVIDALGAGVKMAEALVGLRRSSGMEVTRQGYFFRRPPRERMEELLRFYRASPV
jgi:Asp/Glu/hydantoin racemase